MKAILAIVIAPLVIIGSGFVTLEAQEEQPKIQRTELQRHDLSSQGREIVQVRVALGHGASFGRHKHPGEELIYVLAGTFEYGVEGRAPVTLKAGEVLFIPAGTIHAAKNVGAGTATEIATYIVEKGKPLVVLVE